mmetsp:Transcript_41809/g.83906  ORF Transcript_41809/g.83906 Transcript_41809/m.83906 type:complete len:169 (+) Transcript_41809:572-1078(+)
MSRRSRREGGGSTFQSGRAPCGATPSSNASKSPSGGLRAAGGLGLVRWVRARSGLGPSLACRLARVWFVHLVVGGYELMLSRPSSTAFVAAQSPRRLAAAHGVPTVAASARDHTDAHPHHRWARSDVNMLIKFAADRRQNFSAAQQEVLGKWEKQRKASAVKSHAGLS